MTDDAAKGRYLVAGDMVQIEDLRRVALYPQLNVAALEEQDIASGVSRRAQDRLVAHDGGARAAAQAVHGDAQGRGRLADRSQARRRHRPREHPCDVRLGAPPARPSVREFCVP